MSGFFFSRQHCLRNRSQYCTVLTQNSCDFSCYNRHLSERPWADPNMFWWNTSHRGPRTCDRVCCLDVCAVMCVDDLVLSILDTGVRVFLDQEENHMKTLFRSVYPIVKLRRGPQNPRLGKHRVLKMRNYFHAKYISRWPPYFWKSVLPLKCRLYKNISFGALF